MYELAAEFGCHRTTVAVRLEKTGVAMRFQSRTSAATDSMVRLYVSGLSLLEVGKQLGFCVNAVRNCLRDTRSRRATTPNSWWRELSHWIRRSVKHLLPNDEFTIKETTSHTG